MCFMEMSGGKSGKGHENSVTSKKKKMGKTKSFDFLEENVFVVFVPPTGGIEIKYFYDTRV